MCNIGNPMATRVAIFFKHQGQLVELMCKVAEFVIAYFRYPSVVVAACDRTCACGK